MWQEFQDMDKALKQILLVAVGDVYTISKKHQVTRYANVSTRKLIFCF